MRRLFLCLFAGFLLVSSPAGAATSPNDPYFVVQWGLKRLQAVRAWQVSRGRGAIVAVVDTGVDAHHPDLKGRLLPGHDFADGDDDPSDDNGHGTLVAGIIAATTDNGIGVASIAPEAKILPVRVLGRDGSGTSGHVAEGIRWAVAHGADVINLSLAEEGEHGGPGFQPAGLLADPTVDRAIIDASSEGAVVVVAAGNDATGGKSKTAYDASEPGVIVIGASTPNDRRAAYSNYGAGLDALAPGGGSASDPSDPGCTRDNSVVSVWWNPKTKKSDYGGGCGTSMAVAFASGVAALLRAQGASNERTVDRMLATAVDLGSRGRDDQTGAGRIDAALALDAPPLRVPPKPAPAKTQVSKPKPRREVVAQAGAPSQPAALPSNPAAPAVAAAPSGSDEEQQSRDVAIEIASALLCVLGFGHWIRFALVARWEKSEY